MNLHDINFSFVRMQSCCGSCCDLGGGCAWALPHISIQITHFSLLPVDPSVHSWFYVVYGCYFLAIFWQFRFILSAPTDVTICYLSKTDGFKSKLNATPAQHLHTQIDIGSQRPGAAVNKSQILKFSVCVAGEATATATIQIRGAVTIESGLYVVGHDSNRLKVVVKQFSDAFLWCQTLCLCCFWFFFCVFCLKTCLCFTGWFTCFC